jgi:uncharacterized protein YkwD
MADQPDDDKAGLLPQPDAAETLRLVMRGSASEQSWCRRLLPAGLFSVGFHLFFLPLLMVITVTFADSILGVVTLTTNDNHEQVDNDTMIDPDFDRLEDVLVEEDRTVAVGTEKPEEVPALLPATITTEATKSAALESTTHVHGTVVSVTNSQITIQPLEWVYIDSSPDLRAHGSHRSFQTDQSTNVCLFVARKSLPIEVGSLRSGNLVMIVYAKIDGQHFARTIYTWATTPKIAPPADSVPGSQSEAGGESGAFKMSAEEQEFIDFANDVRMKHGKKPMLANATLFNVARGYAALMVKKESVDVKLDGKDSLTRIMDAGYQAADATTRHAFGSAIFSVWKSHLQTNVLYNFEETGIGIVKDKVGNAYCCWIFATPAKGCLPKADIRGIIHRK